MTRPTRLLSDFSSSSKSSVAEPPEAVAVESNFVVILAVLLCALICVVGLTAVARCAWLRRGSIGNRRSPGQASVNRNLKSEVVQSLPKFRYNSGGNGKLTADCAICLGEYAEGDEIRVLPQCGHGFHVGCVDTWLASHSSCPSCRQILIVTRCRKCGEFPAVSGVESETEQKVKQDEGVSTAAAASTNYLA